MSGGKQTAVWTKEIYYLLAVPIDEFSDSLFSLPYTSIENIVNTLLAGEDFYMDMFNAKITALKSNMAQLPNAKKALRKLDVVCKIVGALGYFDALVDLSGSWDSLKTHGSIDIRRDKAEPLPIDYLFLQCRKFSDDFETLKNEGVIGINGDGSLEWKWQKTALCEYFYYYECRSWRLIERVFNKRNLKQLFNSHMEQQRGKFSSDYEKLKTLLGL
jgi:hypothetical protein